MRRAVLLGILLACSGKRDAARDDQIAQREHALDEKQRELDKKLAELATRPLDGGSGSGSRDVSAEKGVPLDKRILGAAPHPFGPLDKVVPAMTRDDVIAAVPGALRDGDKLTVPSGIAEVGIEIAFDDASRLATVTYTLPATAKELLASAWGAPNAGQAGWLDRRRRWRADLYDDGTLALTGITMFGDVLGRGPDGLAEKRALIGATVEQLRVWFGERFHDATDDDPPELVMPISTDVCASPTLLALELPATGKVTRLHLLQCYDGDDSRRAALAAMEARWGRATPTRTADDRLVFAWQLPGRRLEAVTGEEGWEITITAK
jgi:hypothetical protein